jgi:glycosyltransferase involved in cell wall biosynthesis
MHILFVDTTLTTPPTGGAQAFLVSLADTLVTRNWKVSVVTERGPDRSIVESLRRVKAEVIEDLWRVAELPEERAGRLANWVNSKRPAVYVVSISPDAGWLALPLLDPNIATVSIAHNDVAAFFDPVKHYHALIDCAVAVSEEIHRKLIDECGVPPERARHIPYGINSLSLDEFAARRANEGNANYRLRIGYVGRLEQPQKRVMDFVPLARELEHRGVSFELHLIGDGNDRTLLAQTFKEQAPGVSVKFWGWLSPDEVRDRLAELDVFLLMSDCEGLPVALLEAMGHGLAPVVSKIASGNVQLVNDGQNGFAVPLGDTQAFADRIETLAHDEQLLQLMKERAWEASLEYSVERMVERYVNCFHQLSDSGFSREHRSRAQRPFPIMPSCKSSYPVWMRKLKRRFLATVSPVLWLVCALAFLR